jgi:type II secretory pathway pseudopilin PulG
MNRPEPQRPGRPQRRRGLSIIEAMISLSISALLLTAVAGAFSASSQVIEANDKFFRASQAARISMNQLLTQIRRCSAVEVTDNGRTINLITDDGRDISFTYEELDAEGGQKVLKLINNDVAGSPQYPLASHLSHVSFISDSVADEGGIRHVVRVSVTLIAEVGDNRVRLSGSVSPRRSQHYMK